MRRAAARDDYHARTPRAHGRLARDQSGRDIHRRFARVTLDGCGSVDAARKRDESRFKADANYAQGWRDGNDICKRKK